MELIACWVFIGAFDPEWVKLVLGLAVLGLVVIIGVCRTAIKSPKDRRGSTSPILMDDIPRPNESMLTASDGAEHEITAEDRQREAFHQKALKEAKREQQAASVNVSRIQGLQAKSTSAKDGNLALWLPRQFVVLDLETTGLSPQRDEIIEIGAIRFTIDAEIHDAFQMLVKPKAQIPAGITRLTGITQEMVDADGLPIEQVLAEFTEFIGNLPLVTFNAPFDMGFLHHAGSRHGIRIRNRYACALKAARRAWPELPSHKLADLARYAKLPSDDTHRALGDSKRALQIFAGSVSKIGEKINWEWAPLDWRALDRYNKARDANRAFCTDTHPLESTDLQLAVTRYDDAIERMYDYEAIADDRYADAFILDRLTLCLWKMGQYAKLVERVDGFVGRFPYVESSLMNTVLKRKERAARKIGELSP
ncbi:MAG: 3'-5' exonuclease [Terracidiphilus sp.]|nr:3'-5' exonuclease [Terracidiphilus sp.]